MARTAVVIVTPDERGIAAMHFAKQNFEILHALFFFTPTPTPPEEDVEAKQFMDAVTGKMHVVSSSAVYHTDAAGTVLPEMIRAMVGFDHAVEKSAHGVVSPDIFSNGQMSVQYLSHAANHAYFGSAPPLNRIIISAPMAGIDNDGVKAFIKQNKLQDIVDAAMGNAPIAMAKHFPQSTDAPAVEKTPQMDEVVEHLPVAESKE